MSEIFLHILKFFAGLLIPVLLIVVGAALIAAGLTYEVTFVAWMGAAILGAGVLWGLVLFFFHCGASGFD